MGKGLDLSDAVQRRITGKFPKREQTPRLGMSIQGVTTRKMFSRLASGDSFAHGRDLDDHN